MSEFFGFEQDFVESLRCIPMIVRFNLDRCGIKLKLSHWHAMNAAAKASLVEAPCDRESEIQDYRALILALCDRNSPPQDLAIDPSPEWLQTQQIPAAVVQKAQENQAEISLNQWQQLSSLKRFTLIKLSRSQHENHNFLPALQEFGIYV